MKAITACTDKLTLKSQSFPSSEKYTWEIWYDYNDPILLGNGFQRNRPKMIYIVKTSTHFHWFIKLGIQYI